MRPVLGWFLLIHGAIVFCLGIVAIGLATAAGLSQLSGQLVVSDRNERVFIVLALPGALTLLALGHLMLLFGQSMTPSAWQPLPERRPALWFSLHTLRQGARCALAGVAVASTVLSTVTRWAGTDVVVFGSATALLLAAHHGLTLGIRRLGR